MTIHDNAASPTGQMQAIKHDNLLINFTTEFHRIWDSAGSRAKPAAFWRPTPAPDVLPGYFPLGDVIAAGFDNINHAGAVAVVVCEAEIASSDPAKGKALSRPDDFELIWKDTGTKSRKDGAIWRPIAPEGYVALGSVCSNDHEKPSLNAVRCVRADLVIASNVNELIWNDRGSGAKQSVSVWSIAPPVAAPGEIHLAPGIAISENGYARPENSPAYSLRMPIPLEMNARPVAPTLSGPIPPSEPGASTHTAKLPWFTIKDPLLTPLEQLRSSPFYLLQRTDRYLLVGHQHNPASASRTFRWTAPRVQAPASLLIFARATSVAFEGQWKSSMPTAMAFSAQLEVVFTQSKSHSNEWFNSTPMEIIAFAPKNRTVAVYLIQCDYSLLRADGTTVTSGLSYTDGTSLHISEHTPEEPQVLAPSLQAMAAPLTTIANETDEPVTAAQPELQIATVTDSAT
ncbi:Vps62-related protein [Pseudomonas sp. H1h]|uniref:Vps62-related protein n=1 Tax=Pseudomonas sp. H1h TaxID=1397280 RepID=UPI000469FB3A|nr:Vps62-related protein [Pseudomonas sp. H1h]